MDIDNSLQPEAVARRVLLGDSIRSIHREYQITQGKVLAIVNKYCREADPHTYSVLLSEARHKGLLPLKTLKSKTGKFLNPSWPTRVDLHTHVDYLPELDFRQKNAVKHQGITRLADFTEDFLELVKRKRCSAHVPGLPGAGRKACDQILFIYEKYVRGNKNV